MLLKKRVVDHRQFKKGLINKCLLKIQAHCRTRKKHKLWTCHNELPILYEHSPDLMALE